MIWPFFIQFDTITRLTFGSEVKAQTTAEGAALSAAFDRWLECGGLLSNIKSLIGEWAFILVPGVVQDQKRSHKMLYDLVQKNVDRFNRGEKRVSILDDTWEAGSTTEGFDEAYLQNALMVGGS